MLIVLSLLKDMYLLLWLKVSYGAELSWTADALYMVSLSEGVTVTMMSLMGATHGVLGVGRFGNYMVNAVAAVMLTVRGSWMRRLATEVELE